MPKRGISLQLTYYERRDPVTGQVSGHVRNAHSHASSPKVLEQRRCVRQGMEGTHVSGSDAEENARAIREKFSQVSRGCARGGGGRQRGAA